MTDTIRAVGSSAIVRRFGYRLHPHPIIRKSLPEEIQVGWQFQDAAGATTFVSWGCTRNKSTLKMLIEDVQRQHGPVEVVDLDAPNDQAHGAAWGGNQPQTH